MPDSALVVPARRRLFRPSPGVSGQAVWRPVWSVPAAMRAVRATIVVPGLFALTFKVIGDPQVALFAVFGGFASLVMASFGGTRRDKLIAHLGRHRGAHAPAITAPAEHLAEQRRVPWWR